MEGKDVALAAGWRFLGQAAMDTNAAHANKPTASIQIMRPRTWHKANRSEGLPH